MFYKRRQILDISSDFRFFTLLGSIVLLSDVTPFFNNNSLINSLQFLHQLIALGVFFFYFFAASVFCIIIFLSSSFGELNFPFN